MGANADVHPLRAAEPPALRTIKRALQFASSPAFGTVAVGAGAAMLANMFKQQVLPELQQLAQVAQQTQVNMLAVGAVAAAALIAVLLYKLLNKPVVYLVDFVAHRTDDSWHHTRMQQEVFACRTGQFSSESVLFMRKVLWYSGLGNETSLPPGLVANPQDTTIEAARMEFEVVVVDSIRKLLAKTGVPASQIGVLVVNCSLFSPTPSLAAQIMNALKMKDTTISYNLGGMGCSASPIAVDLARQALQVMPNTYALVVSTENITQNMYNGTEKSMLVPNILFRVGGAAMLLSNKRGDAARAKYRLRHVVRTTLAANDAAFRCCYETEDGLGHRGVQLSRDLTKIAGLALRRNISRMGPLVLPLREKLVYAGVNMVARGLLGLTERVPAYVPDFEAAAKHICIHTGGRGVVDAIEKELRLSKRCVEPSRAALYRYGNTSSSSCWYVLAYIEHFRGVKKGDTVLQLAFGSGFKCNSSVWVANRSFQEAHEAWRGFDLDAMYVDLSRVDVQLRELNARLADEHSKLSIATPGSPTAAKVSADGSSGSGGGSSGLTPRCTIAIAAAAAAKAAAAEAATAGGAGNAASAPSSPL